MTAQLALTYAGITLDCYIYLLAGLKLLGLYIRYLDWLNARYPFK